MYEQVDNWTGYERLVPSLGPFDGLHGRSGDGLPVDTCGTGEVVVGEKN